ncbi:MAG: ABC transporter permease [Flavihumibacter sp.]
MLLHYFKTAWRNLIRNKTFSIINIGGLAIGLAACWLIMLYVGNERSYDRYHQHADRIFRLAQHAEWNGGSFHLALTSPPFAQAVKSSFPEVEEAVRLDAEGGGTISYEGKHIKANDVFFADSSFFQVFDFPFIYGNVHALDQLHSIVVTQSLATKIFGDPSAAIGKTLLFNNNDNNIVTGVIKDVPVNSHFSFSAIRRMPPNQEQAWGNAYLYTYVLLKKGSAIASVNAKLPAFYEKNIKAALEKVAGQANYRLELQPLTAIHLHSNLEYEIVPNGNIRYVIGFSLIAALILLIASINYMNLSTARSSLRVKEIGVRKVNGSARWQLMTMFLAESIVVTFLAAVVSMFLIRLSMPWFLSFIGKEAFAWEPDTWQTIGFTAAFTLTAGMLSGLYPAFFLSGFKLIPALKGQTGGHQGNLRFRQSLVVFQFVVTITMMAACFIIYQQLRYLGNKDLGFNKDQVLTYHLNNLNARNDVQQIKDALLRSPLIESAAVAGNPIGNNNIGKRDFRPETANGDISDKDQAANVLSVDEDFINTLQIKMKEGRNFSKDMPTDKSSKVLINETLAAKNGWVSSVGKKIQIGVDPDGKPLVYEVAGVMKDFNIYSLQYKVEPMIAMMATESGDKDNIYVRLNAHNVSAGLHQVGAVFKKFDAENPFEYHFLDENFARQYQAEKTQGKLLIGFTLLTVAIACLGLFGLITFTAAQRRKEIGIRKVLGSGVNAIVLLLARDLLKLVVIAMFIATPLAWLLMTRWLEDFAYRIHIGWWVFVLAGLTGLLIALATVSVQAVKAALANPVKSLRSE